MTHSPEISCRQTRSWATAAIALMLLGTLCEPVSAQRIRLSQSTPRPAILERNAPIESLLRKAIGAIERKDWKLAIDSLQRILDDPGGALLTADAASADTPTGMTVFESAQDRATLLLASMPPEGIDAYRLLHDGQAKALFERGVRDCDESALRTILARYMVSSYGDDAADVVAGWLLDRNRPAEALELLNRIETMTRDPDVPAAQLAIKRAAAWTMLRDQQRATDVLALAGENDRDGFDFAALQRFVEAGWPESQAGSISAGQESWPILGGDLLRRFQMPAVTPELLGNFPWRFVLPADLEHPSWWEAYWESSAEGTRALPVGEFVVDDGRLFVKSLRQVVALDLESLDPLWVSDRPINVDREQRRKTSFNPLSQLQLVDTSYTAEDYFLKDQIGGALSTGMGMVFSIERDGVGQFPRATVGTPREMFNRFQVYRGTRLVAHDARHGEILWQRGRSGDSTDPLGSVEFLSTPIVIEDKLWVIYADRTDLFLGILSPNNGLLDRKLLLCTVEPAQLRQRGHLAIYPTSDGSSVYVSTGYGVVLSINVNPLTLRWAGQYEQHTGANSTLTYNHWLATPPMMAGGLVLVAPPDSELLMGLDRATGRLAWSLVQPEGAGYVLGIDDERVWLGGERLHCVNLRDGLVEWSTQGNAWQATGRGALSGDQIFVPTVEGLVVVAADTGERVDVRPVGDQPPLGNILCIANSTISVDPNEVRKFPDLTLSYPKALAFYEADPTDRHAAIRLAWMELRRGFPQKAHDVLEQVRAPTRREPNRLSDVDRLRFEALLGICALPDIPDDQAIEKLREAVALAEGGQAQLRATIALAFRLRDAGRTDEAYLSLWNLGLSPAADGYAIIEPRLRNKVRLIIAETLTRFERDLTTQQLRTIADETQEHARQAIVDFEDRITRASARNRLNQLAQMNDVGGAGQASLIALAKFERDHGRFEFAEQYALRAIAQDRMATQTATALRDLVEQYLDPAQHLHHQAADLLARMQSEFARHEIKGGDDLVVSVTDEVARLRTGLDPARVADGAFVAEPKSFRWKAPLARRNSNQPGIGMFTYAPTLPPAFADHVLFAGRNGKLEAIKRIDGAPAWETTLRLLNSRQEAEEDRTDVDEFYHPRLSCQNQIAVINATDGVFGVGVRTGRRLWGTAYEDADTAERLTLRDRLVAVDNGLMVAALRRGVLTCSTLSDAHDVQWERVLSGEKIDSLFVRDGLCITLDNRSRRVNTYSLRSGRLHSSIEFSQPDEDDGRIPVVYENGHLIGPDGAGDVVCFSARSGEENWRIPTPEELRWIFKPGDGYVGISCHGGRVALIDALSGDIKIDRVVPQAAEGYAEGVLRGNRLVLMTMTGTSRGDEPKLVGIDATTGEIDWSRDQLGSMGINRHALWRLLTLAEDVMPMLYRVEVESENAFLRRRGELAIDLIDKQTGRNIGESIRPKIALTEENRLTGEFGLWPGQFIIGSRRALLSVPLTDQQGRELSMEGSP